MLEGLPGVVKIENTTITEWFKSEKWMMKAVGKETILEAKSDVKGINARAHRHGFTGSLNIFDAECIQERIGEYYLPRDYKNTFKNIINFPITDLMFEKFFEKPRQLM